MSIRRTGARKVAVDGCVYLWRVRARPTYRQAMAQSGLVVAVQLEGGRARLVVELTKARPDNWLRADSAVVTPRDVAAFVRLGIRRGWQPAGRGGTFLMRVDDGN